MSPDQILSELKKEFPELSAQQTSLEDMFWESVWELESLLLPPWTHYSSSFSVTDVGSHGEIDLSAVADIIEVLRVGRLGRVPYYKFFRIPSETPTATLFTYDPKSKKVLINKGSSPLPSSLNVAYSARSGKVASSTDLPWLAFAYKDVVRAMRGKLRRVLTGAEETK